MKTFGENIALFRREAGLTQEELSEKMNVTAQAVSKWETGLSQPDLETTANLAKLFNVSIDELVNGKGAVTEVKSAEPEKVEKRVMLINVKNGEDTVVVRVPIVLIIKAHDSGNLSTLVGNRAAGPIAAAIELIKSGTTGIITEVHADDCDVLISVEDHES